MGKGRTKRRRRRRRMQMSPAVGSHGRSHDEACVKLRKWMIQRSSKSDLADTFTLVPFIFPDTGRGLQTKRVISPGAVLVSIPRCLLLTPNTVLHSHMGPMVKGWRSLFTPHQLLALFLVVERHRGDSSEWRVFLDSLPTWYSVPLYFTPDELHLLPPQTRSAAERQGQRWWLAYRQVLGFCRRHWPDADGWMSRDAFRWAWSAVSSRAVFLEGEPEAQQFVDWGLKEENNVALCPYLDLLNHSITARVRAGLNGERGRYEIVTEDGYLPHQQVYISYGPHDNSTLFLQYGFTLPHNPHNCLAFSVDDFVKLREIFSLACWDLKMKELRKHALHRELSCSMDGVSWNMTAAMKILAMDWPQLQRSERVMTEEALPRAVEVLARRMAAHLLSSALEKRQALLAQYPKREEWSAHVSIAHGLLQDELDILTRSLADVG